LGTTQIGGTQSIFGGHKHYLGDTAPNAPRGCEPEL